MVVKDKVGRKRYIAFTVDADRSLRRHEMIRGINQVIPPGMNKEDVRLTVFTQDAGIVLCPHIKKEEMIKALNSIKHIAGTRAEVRTVITSGTIKKAKEKLEKVVKHPL